MQWCLSPYPYITLRVSFTFNILPLSILKMNMTLPFVVNPTLSHLSLSYFLPAGMKGNGMFSLTHRHTIFGIPAQHCLQPPIRVHFLHSKKYIEYSPHHDIVCLYTIVMHTSRSYYLGSIIHNVFIYQHGDTW